MYWTGKITGFFLGWLLFGPIGAIFGLIIGQSFDKGLGSFKPSSEKIAHAQEVFFNTTFLVMGHLAKSDGVVTEAEIRHARLTMSRMGLNDTQRLKAMKLFTRGKQPDFDLASTLNQFMEACGSFRPNLQLFLEIQINAAYADGRLGANEKRIIMIICNRLGFRPWNFEAAGRQQYYQQRQRRPASPSRTTLDESYRILGVSKSNSDAEIKKAYRRLMKRNHPDKLIAKGLPKEMIKVATEKTQQIKAAYEYVRKSRT